MAIVGQFHVLGKVKSLDGGDVPDIKEPDIGEDLAFTDEPGDNPTEDVNVDLEIGGRIDQSELYVVNKKVTSRMSSDSLGDRTPGQQGMPAAHRTISVQRSTTPLQTWP